MGKNVALVAVPMLVCIGMLLEESVRLRGVVDGEPNEPLPRKTLSWDIPLA